MEATGHIDENGVLNLVERAELKQWIKDHKGHTVVLTIDKKKRKRSNDQNEYYWGCVIPMVQRAMNSYGNDYSRNETHEFLKAQFNWKEVVVKDCQYIKVPQSTTKLSTVDFMEYLDKIYLFASEQLGIEIPLPNAQMSIVIHDPAFEHTTIHDTNPI